MDRTEKLQLDFRTLLFVTYQDLCDQKKPVKDTLDKRSLQAMHLLKEHGMVFAKEEGLANQIFEFPFDVEELDLKEKE